MNEDLLTRNFLKKVRLLTEDTTQGQPPTQVEGENQEQNEIIIKKDNDNFIDVVKNINQFVGALKTDEKAMIVYPKENNVIFNGVITDLNNLKFQFVYNDQSGGLYVWADSMLLTKETAEKIAKLIVIRDQWKTYWSNNLSQYIK